MPIARPIVLSAILSAPLLGLAACESPQVKRPMLESSVIESIARPSTVSSPAADLEFFDELASRKLVCHDDAIQAVLLLSGSSIAPTYADREAAARRLGFLDPNFDRPALEAATIGDVSQMLVRVTDPATTSSLSQERAVSRLVTRGWLPTQAKSFQGLTGAQMVTLIATAREEVAAHPRTPAAPPFAAAPAPAPPPPAPEPAARPRPEPMPTVVVEPAQPAAKPAAPVQPAPARPPTIWTPGKPIKKPGA